MDGTPQPPWHLVRGQEVTVEPAVWQGREQLVRGWHEFEGRHHRSGRPSRAHPPGTARYDPVPDGNVILLPVLRKAGTQPEPAHALPARSSAYA